MNLSIQHVGKDSNFNENFIVFHSKSIRNPACEFLKFYKNSECNEKLPFEDHFKKTPYSDIKEFSLQDENHLKNLF